MRFAFCFEISFFTLAHVLLLNPNVCSQEIPVPSNSGAQSVSADDLTSITSCTVQNLRGLHSGDVLISKESLFDNVEADQSGSKGVVGRNHFMVRVCFDVSLERYAYYGLQEQAVTRFPSNKEHAKMKYSAFCYAGNDEPIFTWFSDRLDIKSIDDFGKSISQMHKNFGFPDPRSLPLYGALGPLPMTLEGDTKPRSGELARNIVSASQRGDKIAIKYRFKKSGMDGFETMVSERYQLDNLMLTSKAVSFRNIKSKKVSPFRSFRTRWKEIEGVQVPVALSLEGKVVLDVAGKKERGIEESTYKLTWLSVNKPIENSYFDGSAVSSTERIRTMIQIEKD